MSKKIKWNAGTPVVTKVEFNSGNWHLTKNSDGNHFLTNMDIICTPCGVGTDELETFENMLNRIGEYEEKLKNIKQEIRDHINSIKNGEKNA